jgi:hypothetical protein
MGQQILGQKDSRREGKRPRSQLSHFRALGSSVRPKI